MRSSNTTCLDLLFLRYHARLVDYCRRRCVGLDDDPEDVVQAAYVKCRRSWRPERQSRDHQLAYLYNAVRWLIADGARRQRRRRLFVNAYRPPSSAGEATPLDCLMVAEAVSQLQGRPRRVCKAILQGKRPEQIRRENQMSEGALAVSLSRARRRLVRLLKRTDLESFLVEASARERGRDVENVRLL